MIKEYEKRVEGTFVNEQTLANLTRDYEMSQRNYQGLLDKRLNARISENLEKKQKGEQFRIIDPANLPHKPFKPDRPKIILLGSLLSAGLGIGLILVKEYLSPSYRKPEDFQGTIDLPILGTISKDWVAQRKSRLLITMEEPDSVITEQYRSLYSRMSQLINAHKGEAQTVFAITSSVKHEGKTVISLNLALTAARDFGKKTLLIEGDLKDPMISKYLKSESQGGFIDSILNNSEIQSGTVTFGHDNLSILPAGKRIRNSASILSSQQMKDIISLLKERYDLILIDSPPILSLPDMSIIERLVDGVILVVRAERTPRDAPITAITSLATNRLVGIVLNDTRLPSRRHYRYHYTNA
jgi:capsular exopolysaccharide synthesis family protein